MKQLVLISIILPFLFSACEQNHQHADKSGAITLDQGQKWEANPETTEGIANMQTILNNAKEQDVDLLQLHTDLEGAFQNIFKQCTMTGEAHEHLHDYLIPIQDHLGNLLSASPGEEMNVVDSFLEYLSTYENYFTTAGK